jgi:hypothetical protein
MSHTKLNQKLLNSMSDQEKLDRTTIMAFRERWLFVIDTWYWYIAKSDYPYKDSKEHFIYWIYNLSSWIMDDLSYYQENWYTIIRNQPSKQSVKREHIHLIKF